MIRPRTLVATPLIAIGTVSALLLGAAFYVGQRDAVPPAPIDAYEAPVVKELRAVPAVAPLTAQDLPRHFEGSFIWDGQSAEQSQWLGLDVLSVSEVDGLIVATGRGTYESWRTTQIDIRIEIDPATGELTIWESNPSTAEGFVTEGRHEAIVSDAESLQRIEARWVGDDGDRGTLILNARHTSVRGIAVNDDRFFEPAPAHALRLEGGVRLEKRYAGAGTKCVESTMDEVTVHYSGWSIDGEFDNSWKRGAPATFRPQSLISGWRVALWEMCAGDYARVWIPAELAYGDAPGLGRPTGDLIFDIELIDVAR